MSFRIVIYRRKRHIFPHRGIRAYPPAGLGVQVPGTIVVKAGLQLGIYSFCGVFGCLWLGKSPFRGLFYCNGVHEGILYQLAAPRQAILLRVHNEPPETDSSTGIKLYTLIITVFSQQALFFLLVLYMLQLKIKYAQMQIYRNVD